MNILEVSLYLYPILILYGRQLCIQRRKSERHIFLEPTQASLEFYWKSATSVEKEGTIRKSKWKGTTASEELVRYHQSHPDANFEKLVICYGTNDIRFDKNFCDIPIDSIVYTNYYTTYVKEAKKIVKIIVIYLDFQKAFDILEKPCSKLIGLS
eukprot:sb/3473313/